MLATRMHVPPRWLSHGLMAHERHSNDCRCVPCLCDVARARKYGMFRMRVSLVPNNTVITHIRAQFRTEALYHFRELDRVWLAAECHRVWRLLRTDRVALGIQYSTPGSETLRIVCIGQEVSRELELGHGCRVYG